MKHLVSVKVDNSQLGIQDLFGNFESEQKLTEETPYYILEGKLYFPFIAKAGVYYLYAPGWESQTVYDPERLSWVALGDGGTIYFSWEIIMHEQSGLPIAGFLIATPRETEPNNLQLEQK